MKAFNHLLGECGITFFAEPTLAARYRRRFPACLAEAPLLLPSDGTTLRRSLDQWFDDRSIRPNVVGEFQDSALLKVFGQAGTGVFCVPAVLEGDVRRRYGVSVVGRTDEIVERFYAISGERRVRHPAVAAICDVAKRRLFGE